MRSVVSTERKTDIRVGCIEAGVDYHRFVEPDKGRFKTPETRLLAERRKLVFLFFFGKLSGDIVKYCEYFIFIALGKLCDIFTV